MMRLFFAISLNNSAKNTIQKVIKPLYQQYNNTDINWTKPENYHLTLRFLGEVPLDILSPLTEAVRKAIHNKKPFLLTIKQPIIFPSSTKPKVLALDVLPTLELMTLAQLIDDVVIDLGFKPERYSFKPHISVGYIKNKHLPQPVVSKDSEIKIPANNITLYESNRAKNHGLYIPVATC